ncbi:MAG: hypothetical protein BGO41_04430 [Clostridiales bacterium 38-18]|nr:MAG: hypothetical protein BGO41_04430 [Clostridiales bacterium 38-18]
MNKKLIISLAVVLCVAVVGVFGYGAVKDMLIKKDPVNYLLYSTTKSNHSAVDASFSGKFDLDKEAMTSNMMMLSADPEAMATFVTSLVNNLTVDGKVVYKLDGKNAAFHFYESMNLNYAGKPLIDLALGMDQEQLVIKSNTLYDKGFVMTKTELFDLMKEQEGLDLNKIEIQKYIDVLSLENDPNYKALAKDVKGYETIVRAFLAGLEKGDAVTVTLDDGTNVKCDSLKMTVTYDQMIDLYIDLMNEARNDDKLKVLVKSKIVELLNLALSSGDYELMGFEKAEVESAITEFDTNFETEWNAGIDEAIAMYQDVKDQMSSTLVTDINYDVTIAIDKKYQIRQMTYTLDTMGVKMAQTITFNAFDGDVAIEALSTPENSISIFALSEDEDLAAETGYDIMDQGLTNIIEGEALTTLMTDLKTYSEVLPADEKEGIVGLAEYFFENKDMLKSLIMMNLGY